MYCLITAIVTAAIAAAATHHKKHCLIVGKLELNEVVVTMSLPAQYTEMESTALSDDKLLNQFFDKNH